MFRTCMARAVSSAVRVQSTSRVFKPSVTSFVRFESSQPSKPPQPDAAEVRKIIHENQHELDRDWNAKIITYAELKPKTESPDPNSVLIDVREPDEVMQGMIPSAVNVPLTVLGEALRLSPASFQEKYGFEKPRKDQEVTFYCRSGKRSTSASDIAKRNGFSNILNYTGSWLEWTEKETKP
ncbi:hypothetical protein D9758_002372 [Tetrapyrgos nigripes]|uniref:Rhodanese domain-containing protein n=1 Tax=Tetrapyrgos nigripes TaxID=182062 RepID=A0A8H5GNZ8_9AGAR|nr:hypothetical protein D9758_002372 [Tetrapyrgos nigripes]